MFSEFAGSYWNLDLPADSGASGMFGPVVCVATTVSALSGGASIPSTDRCRLACLLAEAPS